MAADQPRAFTDTPQSKVMSDDGVVAAADRASRTGWAHIVRVELGGPAPETRT